MLHFLLGLEADLIRISPFVPAATSPPPLRAAEIGMRINPRGILYTLPMAGSYVGGDITAGILASGMHRAEELSLLLDIGTNGEVVLGNRDFLVACSASAGPAFEGGSVTCGMRATCGAIDSVRILRHGPAVSTTTIDDGPPVGLCGTGLIDALAEMFLAGLVDRSGRFQVGIARRTASAPATRTTGRSSCWSPAKESGSWPRHRHSPRPTSKTSSAPRGPSTPPPTRLVRSRRAVLRRHPEGLHRRGVRQPARHCQLHHHRTAARRAAGAHPVHRQQFRGGREAGDAQPADVRRGPPHPRPDHLPGTDGRPDVHGTIHRRPVSCRTPICRVSRRCRTTSARLPTDTPTPLKEGPLMTLSIAIAGKGGIGKTTLSALLVRRLREAGIRPILAVDADPNSNLAEALGVEPGRPLAEIREQGSSPEGSPRQRHRPRPRRRRRDPAGHHRGRRLRPDHHGPARRAALLLRRQQPAAQVAGRPVAELRGGGGRQRGRHGASFPPHHQRRRLCCWS